MAITTDRTMFRESLKKFFGYDNFQNVQELAIEKIFEGRQDVYLNLQAGTGKSLCFQLPTVLKADKLAVVFVPTHILAMNQISFLRQNHINAEYLCSRTPRVQIEAIMNHYRTKQFDEKKTQFLYVLVDETSVKLIQDIMIELYKEKVLSYIVFDEAHCASLSSHHYVPAYQDMAQLVRRICPEICKIALTSTANSEAKWDLLQKLDMKNVSFFRSTGYQRTVYYDVQFTDTISKPLEHLVEFINKALHLSDNELSEVPQKCGIIFCRKKQAVKKIAEELKSMNITAVEFHGDLPLHKRESIHERWVSGIIPIIVVTQKFGIGLHIPNVRFVVHWNLPLSFQQLYQESGRISLDGKKAYSRVYYSYDEEENIMTYIKSLARMPDECIDVVSQRLQFFEEVIKYCLQTTCRHVARWSYFGQTVPNCEKHCDVCRNMRDLRSRVDIFLKYRASMRKASSEKLMDKEVKAAVDSVKIEQENTVNTKNIATDVKPTALARNRSFDRLIDELMRNYKITHKNIQYFYNLKQSNVVEIAYRLENSIYANAYLCKKYNHDIIQAVLNIKRATKLGLVCGYLKYFEAQEKPIFRPKPIEVIDLMELDSDGENVVSLKQEPATDSSVKEINPVVTAPKIPEIIDLASEISESETP